MYLTLSTEPVQHSEARSLNLDLESFEALLKNSFIVERTLGAEKFSNGW